MVLSTDLIERINQIWREMAKNDSIWLKTAMSCEVDYDCRTTVVMSICNRGKDPGAERGNQRSSCAGCNVMFLLDAESVFVVMMQFVCIINGEPVQP